MSCDLPLFFYHFTLVFGADRKEKFVDWFGYGATVSIKALEEFEQEYGYALRPEDIVDNGYYNSTFRVPTKATASIWISSRDSLPERQKNWLTSPTRRGERL